MIPPDLPGADLVREGLADLERGNDETIPALLVLIGAPRLRSLGIAIPDVAGGAPEHRLYQLLELEDARKAHSRYNALIRELVSFERAAACVA